MADQVGNYLFASVIGALPRLARRAVPITLEGEDGDSFREIGIHSDVSSLQCMADPTTDAQADNWLDDLSANLQLQRVRVVQYNRIQNGWYLVLNVREPRGRELFAVASGQGVFGGTVKVDVVIDVIRVL